MAGPGWSCTSNKLSGDADGLGTPREGHSFLRPARHSDREQGQGRRDTEQCLSVQASSLLLMSQNVNSQGTCTERESKHLLINTILWPSDVCLQLRSRAGSALQWQPTNEMRGDFHEVFLRTSQRAHVTTHLPSLPVNASRPPSLPPRILPRSSLPWVGKRPSCRLPRSLPSSLSFKQ